MDADLEKQTEETEKPKQMISIAESAETRREKQLKEIKPQMDMD